MQVCIHAQYLEVSMFVSYVFCNHSVSVLVICFYVLKTLNSIYNMCKNVHIVGDTVYHYEICDLHDSWIASLTSSAEKLYLRHVVKQTNQPQWYGKSPNTQENRIIYLKYDYIRSHHKVIYPRHDYISSHPKHIYPIIAQIRTHKQRTNYGNHLGQQIHHRRKKTCKWRYFMTIKHIQSKNDS